MKFPRFGKRYNADGPKETICGRIGQSSIREWGFWSSPMFGAVKGVIVVVVAILALTLVGYGLWFLFGALGMEGENRAVTTTLVSIALVVGAFVGWAIES